MDMDRDNLFFASIIIVIFIMFVVIIYMFANLKARESVCGAEFNVSVKLGRNVLSPECMPKGKRYTKEFFDDLFKKDK